MHSAADDPASTLCPIIHGWARSNVRIVLPYIGRSCSTLHVSLFLVSAGLTRPVLCRLGVQSACLSQGVFEATGRRYVLTWRMLNEVMIICIVPNGTNVLTAHRVSRAIAQLLLLYCKSTTAVTMDRVFKKYVQVLQVPMLVHVFTSAFMHGIRSAHDFTSNNKAICSPASQHHG